MLVAYRQGGCLAWSAQQEHAMALTFEPHHCSPVVRGRVPVEVPRVEHVAGK